MKVITLFCEDIRRISNNVIAWITLMGICIVPCLYAWFNIAASWDPYENTQNIQVAVANEDEGYEGNLIQFHINMGEKIMEQLGVNRQLGWVFTQKEEALQGIHSGKYYAALVIPKNFSRKMMSVFTGRMDKPSIVYYTNEKKNAISQRVTEKGANAIQRNVNEVFSKTVYRVALNSVSSFSNLANKGNMENMAQQLSEQLEKSSGELSNQISTLEALKNMTDSLCSLLTSSNALMESTAGETAGTMEIFDHMKGDLQEMKNMSGGINDAVDEALRKNESYYRRISSALDNYMNGMDQVGGDFSAGLRHLSDQLLARRARQIDIRNQLEQFQSTLPFPLAGLNVFISQMDQMIYMEKDLAQQLNQVANDTQGTLISGKDYKNELNEIMVRNKNQFDKVKKDYDQNVRQNYNQLVDSLMGTGQTMSSFVKGMEQNSDEIANLSSKSLANLKMMSSTLDQTLGLMKNSKDQLDSFAQSVRRLKDGKAAEVMDRISKEEPEKMSSFLAAPVSYETHKLFSVKNYGSAMAPFYSTLAMWVGAVISVALMKVALPKSYEEKWGKITHSQAYFSRLLFFLLVAFLQSTLIALGDLYFLKIQCVFPAAFVFAAWISSLVYMTIVYTLTLSFGEVGKAISVIFMVIQVAGSGGTFPTEMTPFLFRRAYPLLPFVHSMTALRETIGGFYGHTYELALLRLLLFLIPTFLLGLVLRKPIIRLNRTFEEKLEDTRLM